MQCISVYSALWGSSHILHARFVNVSAMRNEKILAGNRALRETFEWVNANRKEFRRPVHGPIVCEITTRDVDASNYLEQHVRNSVLTSFVVECKEDSKLLYREVREKRGMRINIQVVEQGREEPIRRMYSDHKMNILRQEHDVKGYLDEYFEAPPAIMQALRNTSNVQSVLIGGQRTKNNLDNQGLQEYLFEKENGNGKQSFCIFAKERNRMYKVRSGTCVCKNHFSQNHLNSNAYFFLQTVHFNGITLRSIEDVRLN